MIPLTAVADNDPPEIVAPLSDTTPLILPPVICTLLADWVAIVPSPDISPVAIASKVLTWEAVRAIGVADPAVLFPIIELAAKFAIFDKLTFPDPMVVDPVLSIEISPVMDTPVATPPTLPTMILAEVREVDM